MDDKFRRDLNSSESSATVARNLAWRWSMRPVRDVLMPGDSYKDLKGKDWTFVFDDGLVLFEHKADFKAAESWNLAIEYECNGKPSGLASTESTIWISSFKNPDNTGRWISYWANVDELRSILFSEEFPGKVEPNKKTLTMAWRGLRTNGKSGDVSQARVMLLGIEQHVKGKKYWHRLDTLSISRKKIDWVLAGRRA